jgi:excisionase family DNA binding protein
MSNEEITSEQAAEMIGVSHSHFMRILQLERIPYRMAGIHYRLHLKDVIAYREERVRRGKLLDELVQQAQELNMGY